MKKALTTLLALLITASAASAIEPRSKQNQSTFDNPFCAIKTLTKPRVHGYVRALKETDGTPAIYIDKRILSRTELVRFMLAHECCHHSLGHLELSRHANSLDSALQGIGLGHQLELDADCCAARMLNKENDRPGLENAKQFMFRYGPKPTGQGYPSGVQRAMVIRHCAKTDENTSTTIYLNEKKSSKK